MIEEPTAWAKGPLTIRLLLVRLAGVAVGAVGLAIGLVVIVTFRTAEWTIDELSFALLLVVGLLGIGLGMVRRSRGENSASKPPQHHPGRIHPPP
jgi:hypothetical protein